MIYNIQRYCIHDGRGIRTTVFMKGCQIKCPWCANPESQDIRPQLGYLSHKCRECGRCEAVCPQHAIREHQINYDLCDCCGICVYHCPYEALQIYGQEMSVEQLVAEIKKDRAFYERSEGGVTFSGGEATIQPEYLLEAMKELHQEGIHIALESNGLFSAGLRQALLPLVDQFLIDLKHMDDETHRSVLGVSNQPVIENLIGLSGQDLTIRLPVIPGFNDTEKNLRDTAIFARQLGVPLQLLGFHNMGASKYHALNRAYDYESVPSMSVSQLEEKRKICLQEWSEIL